MLSGLRNLHKQIGSISSFYARIESGALSSLSNLASSQLTPNPSSSEPRPAIGDVDGLKAAKFASLSSLAVCRGTSSDQNSVAGRLSAEQNVRWGSFAAGEAGGLNRVDLGKVVAAGFLRDPHLVAADIARNLGSIDRSLLISALSAVDSNPGIEKSISAQSASARQFASTIFENADQQAPKGLLDKNEFIEALKKFSKMQQEMKSAQGYRPVSGKKLLLLAMATGIPYIGFGFLDNFIMILAGEEIEKAFGLALGLSTMAAAALGNTLSDIAGIWMAEAIEV